jgi:hypothetical protein
VCAATLAADEPSQRGTWPTPLPLAAIDALAHFEVVPSGPVFGGATNP